MEQTFQQTPRPAGPPKNWLLESILVTIFCCLPFGIVGIVNAASVNSRYQAGDYDGADRASSEAAKWVKLGFWIGLGLLVLYLIAILVFGATAVWSTRDFEN